MTDLYRDFSGRDFTARYEALLTRLRQEVPELTDLNYSDAGISQLRLLSREVDQLGFYLDEAFAEGFILSARFMQSLIDIAATTDYPPKLASGATTTLRLTRIEGVDGDIAIPQYSTFKRTDGMEYLILDAVTIPDGTEYVDADAVQAVRNVLTLDPEHWSIGAVTNRPRYNLGQHIIAESATISNTELGLVWTEVDSFWRSVSTNKHFLLRLYADKHNGVANTVFLELGDGTQGEGLPQQTVTVTYLTCSGPTGNCGINTIIQPPTALVESITVANPVVASGGAYAEGREAYRTRIPLVTRAQRRGVTVEDYGALVVSISGVRHAQALDRNISASDLRDALWGSGNSYGWPHEYVVLVVVPEGGGAMSSQLKDEIWAQCATWGHLGPWKERYILMDAIEVPVDVSVKIGVSQGYSAEAVRTAVTTAIQNAFAVDNVLIGADLTYVVMYQAIATTAGVAWITLTAPASDTTIPDGHIAVAGTITVTVG